MNVMRSILLSLSLLCFFGAQAQFGGGGSSTNITGKIFGELVDQDSEEGLPYASVVLLNDKGREVSGDVTDDKGKFRIANLKPAKYQIVFSYVGYATDTIKGIELTKKSPDYNLGTHLLALDNVALEEVSVEAKRSLIENKIDRMVYNAEDDATNVNGDASDVMRKVPMVTVDLEGNLALRGSQNVQVLINGKPSSIFSTNVGDALKMIPAEQIKKVEVMTSPSAKYDAEGSGGIINIITQQSRIKGFSGTVNTSVGTRQNQASANLALAAGRFGFNLGGFSYYSWPVDAGFTYSRTNEPGTINETVINQDGINESSRLGYNGRIGAFYDINAFNSINVSGRIGGFNQFLDGVTKFDLDGPITDFSYDRDNDQEQLINNFDITADYTRKFEKEGQEFSAALQLNGSEDDLTSDLIQTALLVGSPAFQQKTFNDGDNRELTAQIDYVHPFTDKIKLETGIKGIYRDIKSEYTYRLLDTLTGKFELDEQLSNFYNYQQDVYAGYASVNYNINKNLGIQLGTRYEKTDIEAQFEDEADPVFIDYYNVVPNLAINKKFKNYSSLRLSYNQRLQRPSLEFINPFINNIDIFNIEVGNPELEPELTHQIDLNYTTFVKGTLINTSVYFKRTEDVIESVTTLQGDVATTSYVNAKANNSFGFNVFSSVNLFKIWEIRTNLAMFSYNTSANVNGEQLSQTGIQYNGFVMSTIDLKKDWKIEGFGFFNSRRLTLQGESPSFSIMMVGVVKELFEDQRGSIGLRIVDPFTEVKNFRTVIDDSNFSQRSNFALPFRSFGVSFNYRFGKLDFQQRQRNSKIRNDDMKAGEGGMGGGNGGGNGGGGFGGN